MWFLKVFLFYRIICSVFYVLFYVELSIGFWIIWTLEKENPKIESFPPSVDLALDNVRIYLYIKLTWSSVIISWIIWTSIITSVVLFILICDFVRVVRSSELKNFHYLMNLYCSQCKITSFFYNNKVLLLNFFLQFFQILWVVVKFYSLELSMFIWVFLNLGC